METTISPNELVRALSLILREAGFADDEQIPIDKDFYWEVLWEQRYDSYEEPRKLSLGQLSDDLKEIRGILAGQRDAIPYCLVWLSSLLRVIGEFPPQRPDHQGGVP